jgi:hypothetical protein
MINPLAIATDGYISDGLNSLSIAIAGYLVEISITNISGGGIPYVGGGVTERKQNKSVEKEKFYKKVTVAVTIGDRIYTKSKIIKNRPNLTVNDVDVDINESGIKPKITIGIIEN